MELNVENGLNDSVHPKAKTIREEIINLNDFLSENQKRYRMGPPEHDRATRNIETIKAQIVEQLDMREKVPMKNCVPIEEHSSEWNLFKEMLIKPFNVALRIFSGSNEADDIGDIEDRDWDILHNRLKKLKGAAEATAFARMSNEYDHITSVAFARRLPPPWPDTYAAKHAVSDGDDPHQRKLSLDRGIFSQTSTDMQDIAVVALELAETLQLKVQNSLLARDVRKRLIELVEILARTMSSYPAESEHLEFIALLRSVQEGLTGLKKLFPPVHVGIGDSRSAVPEPISGLSATERLLRSWKSILLRLLKDWIKNSDLDEAAQLASVCFIDGYDGPEKIDSGREERGLDGTRPQYQAEHLRNIISELAASLPSSNKFEGRPEHGSILDQEKEYGGGYSYVRRVRVENYGEVAVKVFFHRGIDDTRLLRRVAREVMSWRTLEDKNILPFHGFWFGFDSESQFPGFVSPWCSDGDLSRYLNIRFDRNPTLPATKTLAEKMKLFYEIASGLRYLHDVARIAHCDLKPANILVSNGHIRLCDFGISKILNGPKGTFTSHNYTWRWAAPEVAAHYPCPPSTFSDIYSLGTVLLAMVTESEPYESVPTIEVRQVIRQEKSTPYRYCNDAAKATIPNMYLRFMLACWSVSPRNRPNAESALADAKRFKETTWYSNSMLSNNSVN